MNIQERVGSLVHSGRTAAQNVYNNAPMLRYINPNNRYNALATTENTDPSRTRSINGHVVHVLDTNDGVFSNMSAKPSVNNTDPITDHLPSYDEASHDPSPPYWETSVMSEFDEIYIDGIPVGNVLNFLWSLMVSVLFQFLGFVITYLLHTSHAAKNGAQFGLGVTILNLAVYSLPIQIGNKGIESTMGKFEPLDPASLDATNTYSFVGTLDTYESPLNKHTDVSKSNKLINNKPLLSVALFALGIFITVKAAYDFYKVKRLEFSIMYPASTSSTSANGDASGEQTHTESTNSIEMTSDVAQRV